MLAGRPPWPWSSLCRIEWGPAVPGPRQSRLLHVVVPDASDPGMCPAAVSRAERVWLALPAGGDASAWRERIAEWAPAARLSVVECGSSAFGLAGACDRCLSGTLAPPEAQSLLAHLLADDAQAAAPPLLLGAAHAATPARPVARER